MTRSLGQQQQLSTAIPRTDRLVLSRRAWQAHAQRLPKKPNVAQAKVEEKPWPRNVQIGAGVAACLFVPYTAIWVITSTPTLRDAFAPYLPLDRLRSHFGEFEWGVQSYADKGEEVPDGYYQFPSEAPFRERVQQAFVEEAEKETVTANIYFLGDSLRQEVVQLPASTRANPASLMKLAAAEGTPKIAVDFIVSETSSDDGAGDVSFFSDSSEQNVGAEGLLKKTHTFSNWYHSPAIEPQDQRHRSASDNDIDRLRLEYTVEKLEKDLRDPLCTRDHDEMRAELKQAKSDLSRLKWKRRFRL